MGGFYGSVQVRTEDRNEVYKAVEAVSKKGLRFLVGPMLNGWVAVYPQDSGQDLSVAADLAGRLPREIMAMFVHDDDVLAYEYYRDGRRIDQYSSNLDAYEYAELSDDERLAHQGRPETFAHLAEDPARFAALAESLKRQETEREVLMSELLEEFAEVLGIRNAVTSYEYLHENGEIEDIEGWSEFLHVPDLSDEKAKRKEAAARIRKHKQELIKNGRLLAELSDSQGSPWIITFPCPCPSPDGEGFLIAWSLSSGAKKPLEHHGPPWKGKPSPYPCPASPETAQIELSPSGRYLATIPAREPMISVYDLEQDVLVASARQVNRGNRPGFLPDESALFFVNSQRDQGEVVLTPIGRENEPSRVIPITAQAKLAAAHPTSAWLAVIDTLDRLHLVNLATSQVERVKPVGGRKAIPDLAQAVTAQVLAQLERMKTQQANPAFEQPVTDRILAQVERIEKKLAKMQQSPPKWKLPAIIESNPELKQRFEAQTAKLREMMDPQVVIQRLEATRERLARGELLALPIDPRERGVERVFALRFHPSGEWLCMATSEGVRVYPWADVQKEDGDLSRSHLAVDVPETQVEDSTRFSSPPRRGFYDLEIDPKRDRLLFAGSEGRVRFLDFATGQSGILLEPPKPNPIARLVLSRDLTALCLVVDPPEPARGRTRREPTIQFWNYQNISNS